MSSLSIDAPPVLWPHQALWGELGYGPELLARAQAEWGDVVEIRFPGQKWFSVSHPDDVETVLKSSHTRFDKGPQWDNFRALAGEGLIAIETPQWLENRRTLQPAFRSKFHAQYGEQMAQGSQRLAQKWRALTAQSPDGTPVLVASAMAHLTLSNAGRTLFGCDIDDLVAPISRELSFAVRYLSNWHTYAPWKRALGQHIARTRHARFRRALEQLENLGAQIVARHTQTGDDNDLLALILDDQAFDSPREKARRVRDELLTFLFTGHETTATAVSWSWFLLAQNPQARAQLHHELARVVGQRTPTGEDLPNLPFLNQVVQETLRLYPPTWQLLRQTKTVETLGGFRLAAGSIITVSPFAIHRHRDFWEAPEAFLPARFESENSQNRHKFAFIPFGDGPRQCLGMRTALIEAQLILATLAPQFTLDLLPQQPISLAATVTLAPSDGLPMLLRRRF